MPHVARPLVLAALLVGAACARASGPGAASTAATPAAVQRPLADLARQKVVVVPVQELRAADSTGFAGSAGDPARYLAALDDEIAFALGQRGVGEQWMLADAAVRAARRNPTFDVDPHRLPVEELRAGAKRNFPDIAPPLARQLRALTAVADARYVLVPAELRFEGPRGGVRAVLHVALIDARAAQIVWSGDVAGDAVASFSPALAASVAGHLTDLIAAP